MGITDGLTDTAAALQPLWFCSLAFPSSTSLSPLSVSLPPWSPGLKDIAWLTEPSTQLPSSAFTLEIKVGAISPPWTITLNYIDSFIIMVSCLVALRDNVVICLWCKSCSHAFLIHFLLLDLNGCWYLFSSVRLLWNGNVHFVPHEKTELCLLRLLLFKENNPIHDWWFVLWLNFKETEKVTHSLICKHSALYVS